MTCGQRRRRGPDIANLYERVVERIPAEAFPSPKAGCTFVCALVLLLVGLLVFLAASFGDPLELLDRPTESALRFVDRRVMLDAALDGASVTTRRIIRFGDPDLGRIDPTSAAALLDEVRRFDGPSADLLGCAAVFYAEGGEPGKARAVLERLADLAPPLATAIDWAYLEGDTPPPSPDPWMGQAEPGCRRALAGTIAARDNHGAASDWADAETAGAATLLLDRARYVAGARIVLIAAGIVVALLWWLSGRRGTRVACALVEDAWPPTLGTAVLVRGGFWAFVITLLIYALGEITDSPMAALTMPALLAALPFYGLAMHRLLRPQRCGFLRAFGLLPNPAGLGRALLWTLPVFAFDQLGRIAIDRGGHALNLVHHWSERFAEDFVWPTDDVAALVALNFVLFVPFTEEIVFRGVLYATLRNRVRPTSATLLSAAGFAAFHLAMTPFAPFHLSSPTGVAIAFWSGVVWAQAYETTRSLLPGMLAHMLANLLPVASSFFLFG